MEIFENSKVPKEEVERIKHIFDMIEKPLEKLYSEYKAFEYFLENHTFISNLNLLQLVQKRFSLISRKRRKYATRAY